MIFSWTSFKKDSFYFLENGKKIIVHPSVFLPIRYLKQRNKNIAISSVLWSFLTVELGCEYLSNPNAIIGLFTLLTGGLGAKTYLGFLDSKDVIHNYEKQLEKLRK